MQLPSDSKHYGMAPSRLEICSCPGIQEHGGTAANRVEAYGYLEIYSMVARPQVVREQAVIIGHRAFEDISNVP